MSTDRIIEAFESIFDTFGLPDRIRSDNGPQYRGPFNRWCQDNNGIKHETSSPENPQSNGHAERGVRIAKNLMKKSDGNEAKYRKNMRIYRNLPTGDGPSPSELMFNRRWNIHSK